MRLQSNIWKLTIFDMLSEMLFIIPFLTIYWIARGLSLTDVFLLQSIFALVILLLEVPSGYFADRFGRKKSLIVGAFFYFFGMAGYLISSNFWHFLGIEILIGIGVSFISGANKALLYDSLLELNRESENKKIYSRIFSLSSYSSAIAAIVGGMLVVNHESIPFYLQAGFVSLMIPLAFLIKEPTVHKTISQEKPIRVKDIIKFTFSENKAIKWIIIYSAFLASATLSAVWFGQPFWQHVGVPLSWFGFIWAGLAGIRGLFAHFAPKFEKRLGFRNALIALLTFVSTGYIGLALFQNQLWAVGFFILFQIAFAFSRPIITDYINQLTRSNMRATVLSILSMTERLVFSLIAPFIGWTLDAFTFRQAFLISGFFFFVFCCISLLFLKKHEVLSEKS